MCHDQQATAQPVMCSAADCIIFVVSASCSLAAGEGFRVSSRQLGGPHGALTAVSGPRMCPASAKSHVLQLRLLILTPCAALQDGGHECFFLPIPCPIAVTL